MMQVRTENSGRDEDKGTDPIMINKLRHLDTALATRRDEQGATAVEYSIIASLIAAVIVTTVGLLGADVFALFDTAERAFPTP
jgi:pilus assembly protein Flp/PilA